MTPPATPERYKHHRFLAEIIRHGVWLYDRFCLSYRDVEELLFTRGVLVTYEAIRRHCQLKEKSLTNVFSMKKADSMQGAKIQGCVEEHNQQWCISSCTHGEFLT